MNKNWKKVAIGLVGAAIAIFAGTRYLRNSQLLMPSEYKDIKTIVNRLAKANDLGERTITFSIIPGSFVAYYAEDLKLCEEDKCRFFSGLDPFKKFKGASAYEINDAIRQAYIFDDIEGYASSNGTIEISRSTFKTYGKRKNFLACTIAHELDHFITNDVFERKIQANKEIKDLKGKDKEETIELINSQIKRLSESDADNAATLMLLKAGYPLETCLNDTKYIYRILGLGEATKPKDTHPGYEDRIAAMKIFNESLRNNPPEKNTIQTKGKWTYRRDLNVLVFTPFI